MQKPSDLKKPFCRALMLCLVLNLQGCSNLTGSTMPDWIANPQSVYPENRYLAAIGEGDTRRAAENAAAANLSRIFESRIKADERLIDKIRETTRTYEQSSDLTSDITIFSNQTLFNIQYAAAWQDANGRLHAVAYINRRETANIYKSKINALTARIRFHALQAEKTADPLARYAALRAAVRLAAKNTVLLQQLNIIYPGAALDGLQDDTQNELRQALSETARSIAVRIQIKGDADRRITARLEELITRYGFVIGPSPQLMIEGVVHVSDSGQHAANLIFVRYELDAHFKDAEGNILATLRETGREGHITLKEALSRAFRTMENEIESGGAQRLDAYFDTLVNRDES